MLSIRISGLFLAAAALTACQTVEITAPPQAQPVASGGTLQFISEPANAWQKEAFGPLADLVGKTFYGTPFGGGDEVQPDIQSWSWAVGGWAISIRHALADGSYGGETLVYRDNGADALAYVYVTSAGFATDGSFSLKADGSWVAEEEVTGHPSITKVRSTGQMMPDGELRTSSEYYEDGEWVSGHGFVYRETIDQFPLLNGPAAG